MLRPRQGKQLRKPHVALLLLVLCGLFAQSLLAVSGDTHELLLHADAGETYTHAHVPHAHEDEGRDAGATLGALHGLLHQGCAGHCMWIAGCARPVAAVHARALPIPAANLPRPIVRDLNAPFRPPRST